MTSLDRRDNVSDGGTAIPGEVRRWRAFALLAVAFFMTVVDLTIVNVALPTIGRKLHFPESDLQWVVTAYALTYGGFLLLGGRAADLLGRRRLFMAGLAIFTAASLACALATSDMFLIIMRGIQGLGAAVVLPADLAVTGESLEYNEGKDLIFTKQWITDMAAGFLNGHDPRDPAAGPLHADLSGFGPIYIQVGDQELLLDDSRMLARHAQQSGIDVQLDEFPDQQHSFQMAAGLAPEADDSINRFAAWARPKLGLAEPAAESPDGRSAAAALT